MSNRQEQSKCYLKEYLLARQKVSMIAYQHSSIEERAKSSLQDLNGMASDWYTSRYYTTHYYPQKVDQKAEE